MRVIASLLVTLVGVLASGTPIAGSAAEPLRIVYPIEAGRTVLAQQQSYPYQLLDLALARTGIAYELVPVAQPVTEARQRVMLENGQLDIAWFGTSRAFEERLRAIPVPVFKGLLGWRIGIIRRDSQPLFDQVRSVDGLARFLHVQGASWSDVEILGAAGFNVVTGPYEVLPAMIQLQRGDFFSRGVTEIYQEMAKFSPFYPDIAVERSLVLTYPFAMFYFVGPDNIELHGLVHRGLVAAHADGSFDALFNAHPTIAPAIRRARLKDRVRLQIPNPLISDTVRSIPADYWYNPLTPES